MSIATETAERAESREGLASMIRRVKIRNYKSIKNCDVELKPFTILVGRNGSGKSNFLDALRLLSDGLWGGLAQLVRQETPWSAIAVRGTRLEDITIELEIALSSGDQAEYSACFAPCPGSLLQVRSESLVVHDETGVKVRYYCQDGNLVDGFVKDSDVSFPVASSDQLYLKLASVLPEFRPIYDALIEFNIYDLDPRAMRRSHSARTDQFLNGDGNNLESAFDLIERRRPEVKERILQYLKLVVPDISNVSANTWDHTFALVFEESDHDSHPPRKFFMSGMSDGTLRALGILVAINQLANDGRPIRLVGIEEPETALHPAAVGALMGAFREAATHTQVLVTTHGSDLLDDYDPEEDYLLLATMSGGITRIAPIDEASRVVLDKKLDTAGGLLRMDQFEPDLDDLRRQDASSRPADANGGA